MQKFSLDDIRGKVIREGTLHERRIKLIASPLSPAKREGYGCGMTIIPEGHVHEEHSHPTSEELIYVVSGEGTGIVGGEDVSLLPGDILAIDKGEAHRFSNVGREELRLLWIYSPSGPEVRFADD